MSGSYAVVETSTARDRSRRGRPGPDATSEIEEALKPILRIATPEDLQQRQQLRDRAADELRQAKHQVAEDNIDMQIVSGEYDLEGSQITFYFTSTRDRVDFRPLVRDLSSRFGTKVQMLQVGERDRAKLIDGYDVCGQRLCCSSWQTSFPSVSIKMAKEQDLPLNPQKISGVCGRLYCCLTFEYEGYRELRGQMPKVGSMVSTPVGEAKVNSVNLMTKVARLWLTEQHQVVEMPVVDLQMQYGLTVRPVELVQEIEAPLKADAAPPAPASGETAEPGEPGAPSAGTFRRRCGSGGRRRPEASPPRPPWWSPAQSPRRRRHSARPRSLT